MMNMSDLALRVRQAVRIIDPLRVTPLAGLGDVVPTVKVGAAVRTSVFSAARKPGGGTTSSETTPKRKGVSWLLIGAVVIAAVVLVKKGRFRV